MPHNLWEAASILNSSKKISHLTKNVNENAQRRIDTLKVNAGKSAREHETPMSFLNNRSASSLAASRLAMLSNISKDLEILIAEQNGGDALPSSIPRLDTHRSIPTGVRKKPKRLSEKVMDRIDEARLNTNDLKARLSKHRPTRIDKVISNIKVMREFDPRAAMERRDFRDVQNHDRREAARVKGKIQERERREASWLHAYKKEIEIETAMAESHTKLSKTIGDTWTTAAVHGAVMSILVTNLEKTKEISQREVAIRQAGLLIVKHCRLWIRSIRSVKAVKMWTHIRKHLVVFKLWRTIRLKRDAASVLKIWLANKLPRGFKTAIYELLAASRTIQKLVRVPIMQRNLFTQVVLFQCIRHAELENSGFAPIGYYLSHVNRLFKDEQEEYELKKRIWKEAIDYNALQEILATKVAGLSSGDTFEVLGVPFKPHLRMILPTSTIASVSQSAVKNFQRDTDRTAEQLLRQTTSNRIKPTKAHYEQAAAKLKAASDHHVAALNSSLFPGIPAFT